MSLPTIPSRSLLLLEANIDDMSPEVFPYVFELLFDAGARDCWTTPIVMKRGRPAQCLSVLCNPEDEAKIAGIIFRETSTIGLRKLPIERLELEREVIPLETSSGTVGVKVARDAAGNVLNALPEFRDCERLARASGRPLTEIYKEAEARYRARTS